MESQQTNIQTVIRWLLVTEGTGDDLAMGNGGGGFGAALGNGTGQR